MNTIVQPAACESIKLVPNSTADFFQISGIEGKVLLKISDLNCVKHIEKYIGNDEDISISTLRKGVYIARITTNVGVYERKLVKK